MLKESSKMYGFQHPHVVALIGVCLDGGPAPYIIMPFMANGSLLAYLRRNRDSLLVSNEEDNSEVCEQVYSIIYRENLADWSQPAVFGGQQNSIYIAMPLIWRLCMCPALLIEGRGGTCYMSRKVLFSIDQTIYYGIKTSSYEH
ncbi:MAG: protein kinase [Proteobacteria bacterium]|nr:protein kinase [Pseudomonadota bacterium]